MGHYGSEMNNDSDQLDGYYPVALPELTPENMRYNIARANKAEYELRVIKELLISFSRLINGGVVRVL